jgi:hypothetical protein
MNGIQSANILVDVFIDVHTHTHTHTLCKWVSNNMMLTVCQALQKYGIT